MSGSPRLESGPPDWLFEVLGADISGPTRLRWGFTNESWTATLRGRRLVATRMADREAAGSILDRAPEVGRRLAAVGVPTAAPVGPLSNARLRVVVFELVDGAPGIELIGREGGARRLGRLAGWAWKHLRSADRSGLDLDDRWSRPEDLLAEAHQWLDAAAPDLPRSATSALRTGLLRVAPALAGRAAGLVHGDFVPVNLLVREDRLVALLDLEAVRIGEPLLDAAWFEWILRYHHPEVADEAAVAFADESGLDRTDRATATLLAGLPAIRILEILVRSDPTPAARRRWLEQLHRLADTLSS